MKIKNYDVLTKNQKDEFKIKHPEFPTNMRILLVSPSGGGKTNLLMKFLIGDDEDEQLIYYEEIYIFTRTPEQKKYKALDEIYTEIAEKNQIEPFHTISNGAIPEVSSYTKDKAKIVIFDDMLGSDSKTMKIIKDYFTFGRHQNFYAIFFLSQSYYDVPTLIRKNCNYFGIFNLSQKREVNAILYDHPGISSPEQFEENTQEHDFICVNKVLKHIKRNIDEPLINID